MLLTGLVGSWGGVDGCLFFCSGSSSGRVGREAGRIGQESCWPAEMQERVPGASALPLNMLQVALKRCQLLDGTTEGWIFLPLILTHG